MFTAHIDLGQVILAFLIAIIGYFVRRTLNEFGSRLDRHDTILLNLVRDVGMLVGANVNKKS